MRHYYNEIDKFAAEWLRMLIGEGAIPAGDVDERSIEDVRPVELARYAQCHFFAGIGGWPLALRISGWPPQRPCNTASCPCGPFSAAGKGRGFADERHLWPSYFHIHSQQRPAVLFGEQVASAAGLHWHALVRDDSAGEGYAIGAQDLCSAGVGSPNIRQRLFFTAERMGITSGTRPEELGRQRNESAGLTQTSSSDELANTASVGVRAGLRDHRTLAKRRDVAADGSRFGGLEHTVSAGSQGLAGNGPHLVFRPATTGSTASTGAIDQLGHAESRGRGKRGHAAQQGRSGHADGTGRSPRGMAYSDGRNASAEREQLRGQHGQQPQDGGAAVGPVWPSATNGVWRVADWLLCRDGKWRPVEAGTFPLASGVPARVGSLRGYGNAINPWVAAEMIAAYMELRGIRPVLDELSGPFWATRRAA